MSKVSVFQLPIGSHIEPASVRGYYIDLREKAETPVWPPPWFPFPGFHRFIAVGQWGLAAYERYVAGEGDEWLEATLAAARHLVEKQERSPGREGGWLEPFDYPHTLRMRGPWLSAMAQGHCASVLARAYRETGDERFAESARTALIPMEVPTEAGGAMGTLDGRRFPEEYPTVPASFVLNGAIYALWGIYDVWRGIGDDDARAFFEEIAGTLCDNLQRWDTGYWSRYDLYSHPVTINVASGSYHALHVNQLRALHQLLPERAVLAATADRFERYAHRGLNRALAFSHKAAFRLIVPRNHFFARTLPWLQPPHESYVPPG